MSEPLLDQSAETIGAAVRAGEVSAREVVEAALARIEARDPTLCAFTDVTAARALKRADTLDAARARHEVLGPLAGAPFAVKNLFDINGLSTRAGSKINRARSPAVEDATLIRRLEGGGAVLLGALNMGEYAYDFTGENAHDGASRNPHDLDHMTGGSSGGSGGAAAGGLVPLTLGSDTNGSIRVPSSFCGLFGLKPTYGRLSRHGTFPFVASLDHLGPLARSVGDLSMSYDIMQGADPSDPVQAQRSIEPTRRLIEGGLSGVKIARLGGYFARGGEPEAFEAVERAAQALGASETVELKNADIARASAYLITMTEGASLHLDRLRKQPDEFDPDVRDRLIAGAMLPGVWLVKAQKFRRQFREEALQLFRQVDILLAPATPCRAPRVGQKTFMLDGREVLVRPNIGVFTQPISFIGLPVVAAPIWTAGVRLPLGVQIIAPPWREDLALKAARALERAGVAVSPPAPWEP